MTAIDPAVLSTGAALPELRVTPTTVQLFQFSAATDNTHRIHFEKEYAEREGHRHVLVHSHLLAALALRAVTESLTDARLETFDYAIVSSAYPDEELVFSATVEGRDGDRTKLAVTGTAPEGRVVLRGTVETSAG